MNFMRICWGCPPGLGLAIGRARRQAGSLCLSDSAEGGIALLNPALRAGMSMPPCGINKDRQSKQKRKLIATRLGFG